MPGGTAAGTVLGLNFFLVRFNGVGPAAKFTTIEQQITQLKGNKKPIAKTRSQGSPCARGPACPPASYRTGWKIIPFVVTNVINNVILANTMASM